MTVPWRFCADWNPRQELKLLEGIDKFGYGNWPSISLKVEKKPTECKNHYDHYYLNHNPHHIIPDLPHPRAQVKPELQATAALNAGDVESAVYYPGTEIVGYMPHREDFAHEPDNGAESIIAGLELDSDDDEFIISLHLTAIQIYQSRLAKRAFKKRIVKEYGLLDIEKQIAVEGTRLSRRQLRIKNISRPFLRFMSPTSAAKFLQSHYLEAQLSSEIKKLQQYRENGVRTLNGVTLYERLLSERKRRKQNQEAMAKKCYSAEENILYQVLHQGLLKPRKQVSKETKLLDITYSAGVEKLEQEEKELCAICRFQPEAYLQFKMMMLAEFNKCRKLTLAEARKLLKIDVNKTRKIYDFLKGKGLIYI